MSNDDAQPSPADPVGERVYQGVKAYVTSVARPGQRLNLGFLAGRERASLTPVRAALHRLTGEGLVEAYLNAGFRVLPLTRAQLHDLYDLNRMLLREAAARPVRLESELTAWPSRPDEVVVVRDIGRLFRELALRFENVEAIRAVEAVNDRLHRVRMFELGVFNDGVAEVQQIAAHLSDDTNAGLREAIEDYHGRRLKASGAILSAIERRD